MSPIGHPQFGFGRTSAPSEDAEPNLGVNWGRWQRSSPKSERREADSGRCLRDPFVLRTGLSDPNDRPSIQPPQGWHTSVPYGRGSCATGAGAAPGAFVNTAFFRDGPPQDDPAEEAEEGLPLAVLAVADETPPTCPAWGAGAACAADFFGMMFPSSSRKGRNVRWAPPRGPRCGAPFRQIAPRTSEVLRRSGRKPRWPPGALLSLPWGRPPLGGSLRQPVARLSIGWPNIS